jgi:endonuclease YncB( thermonuclease family)
MPVSKGIVAIAVICFAIIGFQIDLPRADDPDPPITKRSAFSGTPIVIDGDTLEFSGQRVRLLNVDAPPAELLCSGVNEAKWPCGEQAITALKEFLSSAGVVHCDDYGPDEYGRPLVGCLAFLKDGAIGIDHWLVLNGWAVLNRDCECRHLKMAATTAMVNKAGLWSATKLPDWD